jgi:ketosteroid isomerase-like protein
MATGSELDPISAATLAAIARFNDAFNRKDVDGVMAAMTDDCVFDNTGPAPDGERFVGQSAVRHAWSDFFASSPNAAFETEEMFVAGERCVALWRYNWVDAAGVAGHVRGVDVFKVRDGRVAEKLAYVKG